MLIGTLIHGTTGCAAGAIFLGRHKLHSREVKRRSRTSLLCRIPTWRPGIVGLNVDLACND
jgi:hypothetical protein